MRSDSLVTHCCCCSQPTRLLPRHDLGPDLAVCPRSGQLHRATASGSVLVDEGAVLAQPVSSAAARAPVVCVDLSKEGYA